MLDIRPAPSDTPSQLSADAWEYISLADILHFVRQNLWTITAPILLCTFIALVYSLSTSPVFTARAQLLIDPKTPILREQTGEVNFSLDAAQVESHITVLRSEKIATAVINHLGLVDDPEFETASTTAWLNPLSWFRRQSAAESAFLKLRHAIGAFAAGLSIRRVGLSYAIEISFSSSNPEKAALIVNATTEAYIQDQIDSKSDAARQASRWLESRLAEIRMQMNAATIRVQEFRTKHDYSIGRKREEIASAAKQAAAGSEQAPLEPTLEELETTAETYRKIYESFLQAYTSSVQRQSYPVSDARIITPATQPLSKSHPRTMLLLALGGLIGFILGVSAAIARHTFGLGLLRR